MNRMFDDVLGSIFDCNQLYNFKARSVAPSRLLTLSGGLQSSFDVTSKEENDDVIVTCDLPGVKKSDVKISCDRNTLTIESKRDGTEIYSTRYHQLDSRWEASKARASLEDGVLRIVVPRTAASERKTIPIE